MPSAARILILLTLVFTGVSNAVQAQEVIRRTSTNLDSYVGTWQYATKTDTFQIVLVKAQWVTDYSITDCVFGVHYYKKNGVVIADYRKLLPNLSYDNQTIYATNAVSPEYKNYFKSNQLGFSFRDWEHRRMVSGWLTRNPNKPTEALWHFNKDEWIERRIFTDIPPEERPKPGYSVPDEVTMIKIK